MTELDNGRQPVIRSAQHHDNPDGTAWVELFGEKGRIANLHFSSRRRASIETTLLMFPGTSRAWVESAHREPVAAPVGCSRMYLR